MVKTLSLTSLTPLISLTTLTSKKFEHLQLDSNPEPLSS